MDRITKLRQIIVKPSLKRVEAAPLLLAKSTLKQVCNTNLRLIDCPPIHDPDAAEPGFYIAMSGDPGWKFGVLLQSVDDGETWETIATAQLPSSFGTVISVNSESFTVKMVFGQLESVSQKLFLAGHNLGLVGRELLYFQNAQLIAHGEYKLSVFSRQQKNSQLQEISVGDCFTLMSGYLVRYTEPNRQLLGIPRLFKAISQGQTHFEVKATKWANVSSWWKRDILDK